MKIKKRNQKLKDFRLVPDTAGKISNGIYIKNDNSELIIKFAWGKDLVYKPLSPKQ